MSLVKIVCKMKRVTEDKNYGKFAVSWLQKNLNCNYTKKLTSVGGSTI